MALVTPKAFMLPAARGISSKAQHQQKTQDVNIRGEFIEGRAKDLPTLLWFADLCEPVANFKSFFTQKDNKVLDYRNVWLLDHRNFGESDHHESFALHDMSDDVMRFMDKENITMATIGGHGFGAKVATVTAVNNMNRFTGVMCLDGGPVDHRYHDAYLELRSYVEAAKKLDLNSVDLAGAYKHLDNHIECPKWRAIFKQNIEKEKNPLQWKMNLDGLHKNMSKFQPDVALWSEAYGLWPGQTFALFPAYSRWIHLSTNTLPFYNVFPRLEGNFPSGNFNTHGTDESPANHWMHEGDHETRWTLSQHMSRWLRWKDGANVLLADKSEAGWKFIPDRGFDVNTNTRHGEYTPEHVHHDYLNTKVYEDSRKARGKEGANQG